MAIGNDMSRRGRSSKRKGNSGELEVRDLLREYGWDTAHRNLQSGGQGGGDLVEAIDGWHIEVKRVERLNLAAAWRQAEAAKCPTESVLLAHRGNMQPWMATVLLTDIMNTGHVWAPVAIGPRASVRAEFMSLPSEAWHIPAMVVSQVANECCATVLLAQLLHVIWSAQRT